MTTRNFQAFDGAPVPHDGRGMEFKSLPFECKVDHAKRLVEGYAATWDRDQVDDEIIPGAFRKTISERGSRIKMLWQHMDPLGMPKHMEEDSTGLFTVGYVSKTQLGNDALVLMADKVVDRMSIGFSVPRGKSMMEVDADGTEVRRIQEIKLHEYSPVTFAANEAAVLTAVKSFRAISRKRGDQMTADVRSQIDEAIAELQSLLKDFGQSPRDPGTADHKSRQPSAGDADPDAILKAIQSANRASAELSIIANRIRMR